MLRTLPSLFLLASLSPVFAIPLETRDDRLPFDSHPSTPVKRAAELRAFNSPASANLDKRASTVIKQQVKNWVFSSCNSYAGDSFVELGNGGTVEGCIDLCIAAGVQSCAVYAGGSCIGSTKANSDAAPHQDSTSSYCLDPCSGDASEACGSRYGGLIYNVVPGPTRLLNDPYWTYKACYRDDAVGERTVKNLVSAGQGKWTIEGCLAAVKAADFAVGGIIYGGEWGSDTIPDVDLVQDSSMCNWRCNDNQAELCGGEHSVDVYFTRQTSKLIDNPSWSYQGCYSDDNSRRTIANLVTAQGPQSWTIEKCLAAVKLAGYSLGGVEYGGECWGANERRGDANKLSSSSCAMRCNDLPTLHAEASTRSTCTSVADPPSTLFPLFPSPLSRFCSPRLLRRSPSLVFVTPLLWFSRCNSGILHSPLSVTFGRKLSSAKKGQRGALLAGVDGGESQSGLPFEMAGLKGAALR